MANIICRPPSCNSSYIVPCSKVEQCINKNLHEIIDGDDSGIPDFCAAVGVCTGSFLRAQIDYSTAGTLYLTYIDGVLNWIPTTSAYTSEMAQDTIGAILSSEFVYDDDAPSITLHHIDWAKVVNPPAFSLITSIGITSADITVGNSPLTANGDISLTLPVINLDVGTFNTITVNAKGQVTAASNIAVSSTISQSVQSGDGLILSFNIAHGLAGTPKSLVLAASQDASDISYYTTDSTNIVINYNVAPPSGTNNLTFNWMANL